MWPSVQTIDEYRVLKRDRGAQRPAMVTIAERHGLPVSELQPFTQGSQLVWGTASHVLKVFAPLWTTDYDVEGAMLRRLSGTELCVPQLEHEGVQDGWPYIVMSRLPGRSMGEVWPSATPSERVSLARRMGATMASINALSTEGLEHLRTDQDTLIAERLPKLRTDQRARGGDDALDEALRLFLEQRPALSPAESVLMHADLTHDHFLVEDGHVTGLIDFADAFIGPWTYDLAAPACTLTRGDEAAERALLEGRGVTPSSELLRSLRTWCVLHRYAHIAIMMREVGAASFNEWLGPHWAWKPDGGADRPTPAS